MGMDISRRIKIMGIKSKRFREIAKACWMSRKVYTLDEAIEILKKCPPVKFDQSVEFRLKLASISRNLTSKCAELYHYRMVQVKRIVIVVFAKGDKVKEALRLAQILRETKNSLKKSKGAGQNLML